MSLEAFQGAIEEQAEAPAFVEVPVKNENVLALRCPECGYISTKRRDAVSIGLHWIFCENYKMEGGRLVAACGFSTDVVQVLTGEVIEKSSADHQ